MVRVVAVELMAAIPPPLTTAVLPEMSIGMPEVVRVPAGPL